MFCKYCAKEIDDKAEICVHCGRRVRNSFAGLLENSGLTRLRPIKEPKSPGLAGSLGFFLSWVLLGPIGYLYLGQWNWFWITLVITVVAYPLTSIGTFIGYHSVIGPAYVLFPFVFAFHQHQMAKELNDAFEMSKDHKES
jgi:hypothetical protein